MTRIPQKQPQNNLATSAPVLSNWQVAPDPQRRAIASFFAPVLSEVQKSAIAWHQKDAATVTVRYGEKTPHLQTPSRTARDYFDPQYPFAQFSIVEKFAARCNIGIQMGRISGKRSDPKCKYLFVIDTDTERATAFVERGLKMRGIGEYADKTGRGKHFYFYTHRQLDNFKDEYFGIEIKAVNWIVITAPSVIADSDGQVTSRYTHVGNVSDPQYVNPERDLDFFEYADGLKLQWVYLANERQTHHNGLTNRTNETIRNGHNYPDGKRTYVYSAARELWDKGYTVDEIRSELALAASNCKKGYLDDVIKSVTARTPKQPNTVRRLNMVQLAEQYVNLRPFTGRAAAKDTRVFLALAKRYMVDNRKGIFRASYREIQDEVGTIASLVTVTACVERLIEKGLLQRAGKNRNRASLYKFGQWVHELYNMRSITSDESSVQFMYHKTDAAQRGALGEIGMQILDTLCSTINPLPFREIVTRTGLNPRTVKKYLHRDEWLQQAGLAEKIAGGWIGHYKTDATLDEEVARPAGTYGKAAAIKTTNEVARAQRQTELFIKARFHDYKLADEFKAVLREYAEYRQAANYPTPTRRNRKPKTEQAQPQETALQLSTESDNSTPAECLPMVDTKTELIENPTSSPAMVKVWACPNCTQQYFGDTPPDLCDYCHDFTTFQRVIRSEDEFIQSLADDFGAVVTDEPAPKSNITLRTDDVTVFQNFGKPQAVEIVPISSAHNANMSLLNAKLITADQYKHNRTKLDAWGKAGDSAAWSKFTHTAKADVAVAQKAMKKGKARK